MEFGLFLIRLVIGETVLSATSVSFRLECRLDLLPSLLVADGRAQ
jgi:hypothetical protein